MRDNKCVVNDVAKAHGGKQEILTSTGVQLPIIIKNGLPYLVHHYPTQKQMDEIVREEFITSTNDWDPTKYNTPEGEPELTIKQFSAIPPGITDSYYNDQGGIRVTKGDAVVVQKPQPEIIVETVVEDSKHKSTPDPVVVESKTGPVDGTKSNIQYQSKPKPKRRRKSLNFIGLTTRGRQFDGKTSHALLVSQITYWKRKKFQQISKEK